MYEAPSRAEIQEKLIAEEIGDHTIHGKTSWISCGFKIQEMQSVCSDVVWECHTDVMPRLSLRYQLRCGDSHPSSEESQIIENK